jgi:hypothetical protein
MLSGLMSLWVILQVWSACKATVICSIILTFNPKAVCLKLLAFHNLFSDP